MLFMLYFSYKQNLDDARAQFNVSGLTCALDAQNNNAISLLSLCVKPMDMRLQQMFNLVMSHNENWKWNQKILVKKKIMKSDDLRDILTESKKQADASSQDADVPHVGRSSEFMTKGSFMFTVFYTNHFA